MNVFIWRRVTWGKRIGIPRGHRLLLNGQFIGGITHREDGRFTSTHIDFPFTTLPAAKRRTATYIIENYTLHGRGWLPTNRGW